MSYDEMRETELINLSRAQRESAMAYDWHVKAYSVYLLRQRGVWLEWSDFNNNPSEYNDGTLDYSECHKDCDDPYCPYMH